MKLKFDREYFGSYTGLLRWATIGFGGAIFGTLSNNHMLIFRPSAQALMWVSVFTWIISVLTMLTGSLSITLHPPGKEACWNMFFAALYLITGAVYGGLEIKPVNGGVNEMAILIFVYAMISLALYLTLAILLYKSSVSGTSMTNKPTAAATPGDDVKAELKEEAKQEENEYVADVEKGAQPQQEVA